jgi:hypothetical protein
MQNKKILLIFNTITLLVFLLLLYNYIYEQAYQVETTQQAVTQKMHVAIQQIDEMLSELSTIAHSIANDLSTGKLHRTQIMERLEKTLETTSYHYGIGVAYIPYVNDPQMRRSSPYYLKSFQSQEEPQLQFTVPCSYHEPNTQVILSQCFVFVDYSLKDIKKLIAPLNIGKTGYGFILSKQAAFIAHPIEEYIKDKKTLFNIAAAQNNKIFKHLAQLAINGETGVIDTSNQITEQSSWIFYQPIPTTGWTMVVIVTKNEILESLKYQQIWLSISLIIFLICFFALLFRMSPWTLTFSTAILLLTAISLLWFIAETSPLHPKDDTAIIVNNASLNQFLAKNAKQTIFIPTGVLIESIQFIENNSVILNGQIWQKYPIDKDISRNLILPKAKSMQISEISRYTENQTEMIKWHFEGIINQQFDDYSKYPFDNRTINLMIAHTNNQVILTPDLAQNTIMGVKQGLYLPDWTIKQHFFNYKTKKLKFYFTIFAQKQFNNFAIISFLPIFIVLGMLFAILLLLGKIKNFTTVIAPLSALFLGTILAHIGQKTEIGIFRITYIDYFYLVTYIAILAVVSCYLLFYNKNKLSYVAKLLFWPLILGTLLAITIWVFY